MLLTMAFDGDVSVIAVYMERCRNKSTMTGDSVGLRKYFCDVLPKITLGKDEVAGSNPAISSIEILQNLAGFRFFIAVIVGLKGQFIHQSHTPMRWARPYPGWLRGP